MSASLSNLLSRVLSSPGAIRPIRDADSFMSALYRVRYEIRPHVEREPNCANYAGSAWHSRTCRRLRRWCGKYSLNIALEQGKTALEESPCSRENEVNRHAAAMYPKIIWCVEMKKRDHLCQIR